MSPRRALITGGGGQLASDLELQLAGSWEAAAPARVELDVTDDQAVERVIADLRPEVVFNCAAYHNVDACEQNESLAFDVNARAVKRLAERCAAVDARLVHLSTNYVFDGSRPEPYAEDDLPSPRSAYAISKLAGEFAALAYCPGALVVRTAGLYGLRGSASKGGNFVTRMIARARERGEIRMVADQRLTPTFTADLAAVLIDAAETGVDGIVHLTNSGECSWYEFTVAIMELSGIEARIEPGATSRPPGGADRPLNGVLARPRADSLGMPALREWRDALSDYLERAEVVAVGSAQDRAS
ncbi:MAG TPA: dTDP-4-dehydrorhamnose reductase [Solirubrobacterales bacterium]|nr:dTDP-4-dehydrorhamnose reductase [Solirubrobacterales bacterium]